MTDPMNLVYESIDRDHAEQPASTRRNFVAGAAAAVGSLGLLGLPRDAMAANTPQNILNVAATAEVLATIVNTVGAERLVNELDATTLRNVRAAAREELIRFHVLRGVGAREATRRIWVPDAVFASPSGLLNTLVAGDQIFINAYLIGTTAFAQARQSKFARFTGEFMGAEAVHRALALQSLGRLGNDRAFMRFEFTRIETAVSRLQRAGFGFGRQGRGPGAFYDFDTVRRRTPNPAEVNTRTPR